MSYQVLARKWRPQKFSDVLGQKQVLIALENSLSYARIHHAYLFSGTRGVGKTSIARLFAKGLNCEIGISSTPCGVCDNCQEIERGCFIDLLEIDAASRTRVEDTRELLYHMQYAPVRGRFKVYLIDEVHMLSRHSFNALLKTLEEPPQHVKFLLATTEPLKLPITILSRCLQFHLKLLDIEEIRAQLEKIVTAEGLTADPRALHLLARAAEGSMRDALSLTDQAIAIECHHLTIENVSEMLGTLDNNWSLSIIESLVEADSEKVMHFIEQSSLLGVDWENFLIEILTLLHRIAILQLLPNKLDNYYISIEHRLRALANTLPPSDLQLFYQILLTGRKDLNYFPDRRMGIEMTLLRALAFHPHVVISEPVPASQGILPSILVQNTSLSNNTNCKVVTDSAMNLYSDFSDKEVQSQENMLIHAEEKSIISDINTAQLLHARSQIRHKSVSKIDPKLSTNLPINLQQIKPKS